MDVSEHERSRACATTFSELSSLFDRASARGDRRLPLLLRAARSRLRPRAPAARAEPRVDRRRAALDLAVCTAAAGRGTSGPAAAPGPDAPCRGPEARRGARRRRALAEARHRQPDPLVQGPRRRDRRRQGSRARPPDALLLVDWQPRERRRGTRGGRRDAGGGLLPGRPRAREADRDRRLRRDPLRRRRLLRRRQPAHGRALVRARVGVRERPAPLVLRGRLEDDRLRARRAARLARPDRRVRPDRLRRALLEDPPGLRRAARARARRRRADAPLRGPGGGLCARGDGLRRGRPRRPRAPGHGGALDRDRQPGRRQPGARDRVRVGRGDLRRARGRDRLEHRRAGAVDGGLRRDRAGRDLRRAQAGGLRGKRRRRRPRRAARERGRPEDTGLVRHLVEPRTIKADADLFIEDELARGGWTETGAAIGSLTGVA